MTRSRVLVTGGAGFIGSHLVDGLLASGHDVTVIDNESTGSRTNLPDAADFVHGDVRTDDDLRRAFDPVPDAVFHVAGQASIRLAFANPHADLGVNVTGTLKVLETCLELGVPRLVFASSMTVYGNPARVPTPEDEPVDPVPFYGITKYAAEPYVHLTVSFSPSAGPTRGDQSRTSRIALMSAADDRTSPGCADALRTSYESRVWPSSARTASHRALTGVGRPLPTLSTLPTEFGLSRH